MPRNAAAREGGKTMSKIPQEQVPPGFAHLVRRGSGYQLIAEAWEQTL
jgi:hypothetical protein